MWSGLTLCRKPPVISRHQSPWETPISWPWSDALMATRAKST